MVTPRPSLENHLTIKQFGVYIVDLNPRIGTKPGKLRPCVVIQDNALNDALHPSTVILPITSNKVVADAFPLRVHLPRGEAGLLKDSMVLVDQFLAWDNTLFIEEIGQLSLPKRRELALACREFFGWS